jgi:hypothetical protein
MWDLFGIAWNALEMEDVGRFLADADDEPLLWEAKGDTLDPHHVRKTVCGFANSVEGGYLILGASKTAATGQWKLDGMDFKEEPRPWIQKIVRESGLRPVPVVDAHAWSTSKRRHVAVVRVDPIAVPPCVCRGTVYERVSGATMPVKEPIRLAELYERGRGAHMRGQTVADAAARRLIALPSHQKIDRPEFPQLALGLATVAYKPDISSRLFTETFVRSIRSVIATTLGADDTSGPPIVTQQALQIDAVPRSMMMDTAWIVRADWDGGVGVYYGWREDDLYHIESYLPQVLAKAWPAALELVAALPDRASDPETLGGYGPFYVTIMAAGGHFPANEGKEGRLADLRLVQRGPFFTDPGPANQLPGIERELRRSIGQWAYEPDEPR